MNPLRFLRGFVALPSSRRRQWLALRRDRLVTWAWYARWLCSCGRGAIVGKPLFWTPEFIALGARVLVWPGCRIEGIHEYLGVHHSPEIRFGDDVSLQQHCHIVAAAELVIGNETTISSNVFITDSDHDHEAVGVNVLAQPLQIRPTRVGRSCFIGVGARLLAGTQLGDHCVVAANAVVRGTFPDHCVIAGIPARILKRFDAASGTWRKTNPEGEFL